MDLFTPIVDEHRLHPHFKSLMEPERAPGRAVLSAWAEGFPDRDGKMVQEFQISFNSAFWEIYLYAVFGDYGFDFDWSHAAPDFQLSREGQPFLVEAVTANAAQGKPNEWDRQISLEALRNLNIDIDALNREAMVRLANAIHGKARKFADSYSKLEHVARKPFVLAIAPFEQPHFNHQYNRPIMSVLYDHYVDEPAFMRNPDRFPNGPPTRHLGFVTKDNGAQIELGLFNDDRMRQISAVLFSCTATWGKVSALTPQTATNQTMMRTLWGSTPDGRPIARVGRADEIGETLIDGLQVYHNRFASCPLDPAFFRRRGVVQHYFDEASMRWKVEGLEHSLMHRMPITVVARDDVGPEPAEHAAS